MCIGPLAPKIPKLPVATPPPSPTPPPQLQDPKITGARKKSRQVAALAKGRGSTIATSALGLGSGADKKKKLLGV